MIVTEIGAETLVNKNFDCRSLHERDHYYLTSAASQCDADCDIMLYFNAIEFKRRLASTRSWEAFSYLREAEAGRPALGKL
jgi:hypothetical protein